MLQNNAENAIINLEAVSSLIANQTSTNTLLTNSYYQQGLDFYNQHKTKEAIFSLEKSHSRSPENQGVNCVLAIAYMNDARDLAYFGNIDESKIQSEKAKSLCLFKGIDNIAADVSIANGQSYMRHGSWDKARESLKEIDERKTPERFKLSSELIKETYTAPEKLAKLEEVKKWQNQIPNVTGISCYFENESNQCNKIEFFDDERRIGMGFSDMSRVEFEENGKNIILKDTDKNGQLDTFEATEGAKRRVLVEQDGDYRLDAELIFDEKGQMIDEKHYSGRALIHIPYGVIADKSPDILSKPDAYLKVSLNNTYVGKTDIVNNDQTPSWNQAFVQDYKKDDCIYVSMWDYDPLDPDDLIDNFKICDFSASGILYGRNDKAAIQVKVEPTTLQKGVYDVKSLEKKENPFSYSDFTKSDPKLQSIIDRAKRAEEDTDALSSIAINVTPYIVTPVLGLEGIRGIKGFIINQGVDAVISKGMEILLKNNNIIKQNDNPTINE